MWGSSKVVHPEKLHKGRITGRACRAFISPLCDVSASHLAFIWPGQHIMCIGFARGVLMATMTVNTPDRNEQPLMTRLLRGFRARIDAFVSSRLRNAVPKATGVEGSR